MFRYGPVVMRWRDPGRLASGAAERHAGHLQPLIPWSASQLSRVL